MNRWIATSMRTALICCRLFGVHGGSKNWATSSRQRARPNQARVAAALAKGCVQSQFGERRRRRRDRASRGRAASTRRPDREKVARVGEGRRSTKAPSASRLRARVGRSLGSSQSRSALIAGQSARSIPGASPGPASGKAPTLRRGSGGRDRRTIAPQSPGTETARSLFRAPGPMTRNRRRGMQQPGWPATIRVTCGFSISGPPICSAAGPHNFASSVSICGSGTEMPWPSRNEADAASDGIIGIDLRCSKTIFIIAQLPRSAP